MKRRVSTAGVRLALLATVCFVAGCAANEPRRAALDSLQAQLHSHDAPTANRAALVLLSTGTDDAYKITTRALANGTTPSTRAAVISAYTVLEDPRIEPQVLTLLGDDSEQIVALAQTYIERVVGSQAAPELLAIAVDRRRSTAERTVALEILASVGTADSVAGLVGLLEDEPANEPVSAGAVSALQGITYQPFGLEPERWRQWYRQNRRLSIDEWRDVGSAYYSETQRLQATVEARDAELSRRDEELTAVYKKQVDLGLEIHSVDRERGYQIVLDVLTNARPVEAQRYAAEVLGKARVVAAAPSLIEKARGFDTGLVKACLDALGQIVDSDELDASVLSDATDVLVLNLSAGESALRLSAVEACARTKDFDLSLLLPLTADSSESVRTAVARVFGARQWAPSFDSLTVMLDDQSSKVRAEAAASLGALRDKRAVSSLVDHVGDSDETVRWKVVRGLGQLGDPEDVNPLIFDALVEATRDDEPTVQQVAVIGLVRLRDRRAVDRLLEMTLEEPDDSVADQAWTSLLELVNSDADLILTLSAQLSSMGSSDRAETLLKILADDTTESESPERSQARVEARRKLAASYAEAGNSQAAAYYFRRVLDEMDSDPQAIEGLGWALKELDDWEGLAGLLARRVVAGDASPQLRSDYLDALTRLASREEYDAVVASISQVMASASSEGGEFRSALEDILARALPAYMKALVAALGAEDETARQNAAAALSQYGLEAGPALVEGLESPSEAVRTASHEILKAIAGDSDFGFDPARPASEQPGALALWRAWLQPPEAEPTI